MPSNATLNTGVSGKYGLIRIANVATWNMTPGTPPTISSSADVIECTGWTFEAKCNVHQYASNLSYGFKRAVAGTKSGSGTCKGMFDRTDVIWGDIREGQDLALQLYPNEDHYILARALVESLKLNEDFDNGDVVSWDISWVTNGPWWLVSESTSFGEA
jgi:hypothetical protein